MARTRKTARRVIGVGVVAAAGYAVWRAFEARKVATGVSWQPQPFPYPPRPIEHETAPAGTEPASAEPASAEQAPAEQPWVEPDGAACPTTHPVKAKLSSGIFHLPGGASYARTKPDRCYVTGDAAVADGLRAAAR